MSNRPINRIKKSIKMQKSDRSLLAFLIFRNKDRLLHRIHDAYYHHENIAYLHNYERRMSRLSHQSIKFMVSKKKIDNVKMYANTIYKNIEPKQMVYVWATRKYCNVR